MQGFPVDWKLRGWISEHFLSELYLYLLEHTVELKELTFLSA